MRKVFITTVPEQPVGKLAAHVYQTDQEDLKSEFETAYPIFNVLENEHGKEHELVLIIIKQPGESFDYNLEILKKEIKAFEEKYDEKINTILIHRGIEETLDLGWKLLAMLPRSEHKRIRDDMLDKYLPKAEDAKEG